MELSNLVDKSRDRSVLSEQYAEFHKHGGSETDTSYSDNVEEKSVGKPKMLQDMLDSFLSRESLFKNKAVLHSNYLPDIIPHREGELVQLAKILAPALRGNRCLTYSFTGKRE